MAWFARMDRATARTTCLLPWAFQPGRTPRMANLCVPSLLSTPIRRTWRHPFLPTSPGQTPSPAWNWDGAKHGHGTGRTFGLCIVQNWRAYGLPVPLKFMACSSACGRLLWTFQHSGSHAISRLSPHLLTLRDSDAKRRVRQLGAFTYAPQHQRRTNSFWNDSVAMRTASRILAPLAHQSRGGITHNTLFGALLGCGVATPLPRFGSSRRSPSRDALIAAWQHFLLQICLLPVTGSSLTPLPPRLWLPFCASCAERWMLADAKRLLSLMN